MTPVNRRSPFERKERSMGEITFALLIVWLIAVTLKS